jgi:type I restriction enzyme S subunit
VIAGWQTKSLGELAEVFADGDWVESKDQSTEGVRLIQTGNVGEGVFKDRAEKARYFSEDTFKRLRCTEIFEGDCLISRLPDPVGRSCLLPDTGERMITAVDCTVVRFNTNQLIPTFFNYFSQSSDYLDAVNAETSGTTRTRISRSNLGKIAVPVPPLPEQQRIVGILDEAFDGIATANANAVQNLQNARALFENHLQSVFTQRGEGWVEKRLGDVVTRLTNGYVGPTRNIYHESGVPYLLARHVKNNRLLFDGRTFITEEFNQKNKKSMLKEGDVLLVQSGHIGHSAVVTKEHEGHNCHAMIVITSVQGAFIGSFLSLFFNSAEMKQKFQEIRSGSTVPHLTCGEVKELIVALPDLATQRRIVDRARELEEETQRLESLYQRKLAALAELKKSLLHQAFSGML